MRQAVIQNPSVGPTIEAIRKTLGLSQEALARLLGVSVRTIHCTVGKGGRSASTIQSLS